MIKNYILFFISFIELTANVFAQDFLRSPQTDEQSQIQASQETPSTSEKSPIRLNLILSKEMIANITDKDTSNEAGIKSLRPESDAVYREDKKRWEEQRLYKKTEEAELIRQRERRDRCAFRIGTPKTPECYY